MSLSNDNENQWVNNQDENMLTKHQTLRFYEKNWAYNELLKKCTFSLEITAVQPKQNFILDRFYVI